MPGLKGLRSLVAGAVIFLNVGVAAPYADAPRPQALTEQAQSAPDPDCAESDLKWLRAAPVAEQRADRPISIHPDLNVANAAVVGNGGQPLDVPANAGGSRRFRKIVTALAAAALPGVGRVVGQAVAKAIEMGLELVLK